MPTARQAWRALLRADQAAFRARACGRAAARARAEAAAERARADFSDALWRASLIAPCEQPVGPPAQ